MAFALRDYQLKLVSDGLTALDSGGKPALFAPTGAGKSIVLAELAKRRIESGRRVMVSCHRREILKHLIPTIEKHIDIQVDVIAADEKRPMDEMKSEIVVCMMPTISRRLHKIPDDWIGIFDLLADECHHATADSWSKVIEALNPASLLGCSATLVSCNKQPLSKHFSDVIYGPSIQELVDQSFLARPILYGADPSQSIHSTGLKSRGGDFVMDGEAARRAIEVAGATVDVWKALNPDREMTLTACVNIAHAEELAEAFSSAGVTAAVVHGRMPDKERDGLLRSFATGNIEVLTFCELIDEGFDVPEASVIQWVRPTKSIRKHRQINGRGARITDTKREFKIIDQAGNWKHLPMPTEHIEWQLSQPAEMGARRRAIDPSRQEIVQDESGVIELRDITAERFSEIELESRPPVSKLTLEFAARNGADGVRQFLEERNLNPKELRDIWGTFSNAASGLLRALRASETATLDTFRAVGAAFDFSVRWPFAEYEKSLADEMRRGKNYHRIRLLRKEIVDCLQDAVSTGELGRGALMPGRIELQSCRLGSLVVRINGRGIDARYHETLQERTQAALSSRLHPRPVQVVVNCGETATVGGRVALQSMVDALFANDDEAAA